MCLAQGHNTVTPVRLAPAPCQSQVKHSPTEPLLSLQIAFKINLLEIHRNHEGYSTSTRFCCMQTVNNTGADQPALTLSTETIKKGLYFTTLGLIMTLWNATNEGADMNIARCSAPLLFQGTKIPLVHS